MKIFTIKTHKIRPYQENLLEILDKYLKRLKERSVLVITSKIAAICEGRVVEIGKADKKELREFHIDMKDDLYGRLLKGVKWRRGGNKQKDNF